jgi:hypothetical protein
MGRHRARSSALLDIAVLGRPAGSAVASWDERDSPVKGDNVIDISEMKKWLESKGLKSS